MTHRTSLWLSLVAITSLVGCPAANNNLPPEDDVISEKADDATPLEDQSPPTDGDLDAGPDIVSPVDVVAGDSIDGTVDDSTAEDVSPDTGPDVSTDMPCRTRCSGFCSDPDTDIHNCGTCGNDCSLRAGVDMSRVRCTAGRCVFTDACLAGRANCTGDPDDGCESIVTTAARCGTCTNTCRDPAPNCGMMAGAPGGYACTSGCVGAGSMRCGSVCTDTMSDARNCGACGTVCPTTSGGTGACVAGRCTVTCPTNYGDCDGNVSNGCETFLRSSITHCGMCANACPPGPGGTPLCSLGVCSITCATGTGNCDGMASNGCEADLRASVMNCGACGNACVSRPGSIPSCVSGTCNVTCDTGYSNCNVSVVDGCEARLSADPLNCGSCGRRCAAAVNAAAACIDSTCGIMCNTGFGNCDGNGLNGCESNVSSDARNCGACGMVCPSATGAMGTCTAGRCGLACMAGQGNCNMNPSDGCEVDTNTSNSNCGACGNICSAPSGGTARCMTGRCVVECNDGYTLTGGLCVRAAPRPVSPPYGSFVTSRRPRLRVALPLGQTGARIELCADRACTSVATSVTFTGASGDASLTLAAGTYFWRAAGTIAGAVVTPFGNVSEFSVMAAMSATVSSYWGPFLDAGGDRFADLLVGAPSNNRSISWNNTSGAISSFSYSLINGGSSAGSSVASAGDLNADGYGDAAIGAPTVNTVAIHQGTTSGLPTSPTVTLNGPTGIVRFGASVSSAGDVNADGYADLVVGAPGSNRAFLYYGRTTGIDTTATPVTLIPTGGSANFGISVAGVGDVNADGYGDIAVGTDGASIVYVWYGSATGLGVTPTGLSAPSGAMGFGRAISGAGDVNGDGYPDVIVGAYNSSTAYMFYGSASGLSSSPGATLTGSGSQFGFSVDGAGDLNGDGFNDVVVGAPGSDRVFAFYGMSGSVSTTPSYTFPTSYTLAQYGAAVSGFGDFNNDGFGDIAIGMPGRYYYVQIFRGTSSGPALQATFTSPAYVSTGTSIAARRVVRRPRS